MVITWLLYISIFVYLYIINITEFCIYRTTMQIDACAYTRIYLHGRMTTYPILLQKHSNLSFTEKVHFA